MKWLYPLRVEASLHETIWGGQRLGRDRWKRLPSLEARIGEAWETDIRAVVQNGHYEGKTLGELVAELGEALLGAQAQSITGLNFPLLAKFLDANAPLSVQVHPDDMYAAQWEDGKLGKTECWYVLAAEPHATIVHGFKAPTSRAEAQQAIKRGVLEELLHEEEVRAGDVISVPAGTVHAIGSGVMLYELQEYSDITYRLYDYGRLTPADVPRELQVERSLDVAHFGVSARIKARPVTLEGENGYAERCLAACRYFVMREVNLKQQTNLPGYLTGRTEASCLIITSLGADALVRYGQTYAQSETLTRGQTLILPAALGNYAIEGAGTFVYSYVPTPGDTAWQLWEEHNGAMAAH